MTINYEIHQNGQSRSFPDGDAFLGNAAESGEVAIYLGLPYREDASKTAILIELGTECLGVHTGENAGLEGSNVLGFARYRNGDDAPSQLIELVRQPATPQSAIDAAKMVFEEAGFSVSLCADQAGRIIDRLTRPKYNDALRFLDEGLATAADMDLTCKMGLGYPDGPIERLQRGGLAHHYDVSKALFDIHGAPAFAPGRRATVAKMREGK
ncbi:3-hydroxyacyl-CoA dehydrogenase family protein [Hwanghaeella sp.]|uniref:3-hydroxyacyl-CoA dehydrogenase family protein n=1 Tax=Hwanghaeella sp. TaxID=2605943 RepID=UPI003CCB7AE5